ncbi:MAG: sigma-70 family RNA polymerase sigma factor [Eubacterium sp.]|nr:sigma-70 family RNA polymerase sigma factor [Eubacterium sp.]
MTEKISDLNNLSDEELIELFRGGEEQAVDTLINRYKGMVRKSARALYLIGGENDDLIQEGMIALYKAVRSYDEKAASTGGFAPYASTCISNHLYNVIKSANRLKNSPLNSSISLDAPASLSNKEDDSRTIADTLPPDINSDPERILIDRENVTDIKESLMSRLSSFERDVVLLYIEGESISSIGKKLNKTPKSIDNALQRVKKKLS